MASMNETTTTGLQPRKGRLQRFLPRPVPGTYSSPNSQAEGQGLQGFDKHNTLLSREMAENKERRLLDMKAATSKSKSGLKEQEAQQNQNIIESTVRSEPGTLISRAHNVTSFISESQLEAINDQTTSSSSAAAASYSGAIAVASSSSSRRSKPSAARNLSMLHLLPIIPINTSGESQETKEPPAVVRKLSNLGSLTWNVLPSIKTSVAASKGTFLQRDSVAAVISINHAANHHHQADGGEGDGGASGADDCLLSSSPQYSQLARTTETSTVGNSIINKAGSETPSSSGVIAGVSQPVRLHNLPSSSRYNAAAATALFNSSPGRNAGGPTRPTSRLTMQQPSPAGRSNSLLLLSSMSSCSELLAGDCTISDAGCSASRR
ncbi:hypothetical protein CEUSTIGMA_g11525.t1 [Chlamydomonas eustigma]|uniref:Uncharacterized protein n=1 Tax=Chlamydomonas eustigma TaxID=1157962 RepID=A0A250XMH9_9CHLO|nr:hypothetical protein CEUSTIGMA_g11525.t1 [Chlamydomonas eustigma]|eukprot:GAX84102.1 hypothetical protein CEUSTIGMA_g11525.t1 [Chlamydomonas eustigma]